MEKRIISCCSRCRHAYFCNSNVPAYVSSCPAVRLVCFCLFTFVRAQFGSILIFILIAFCVLQLHNFICASSDPVGAATIHAYESVFFLLTPKIDFITSGSGQRLLVSTLCYSPNFLSANARVSVVFSSVAFDFYCANEANSCIRRILDKIKIMK